MVQFLYNKNIFIKEDQALGGQAQAEAQIEKIRASNMDIREKYKSIQEIRSSFASKKPDKSSSLRTILTTSSTMTMGAILVYPLCFKNSGVICGIVVTIIVAYMQWKTCSILLFHIKTEEDDMSLTINRIMGKVWKYIFNTSAALLFVCAVLIYFLLAANMIYPIVKIFMHFGGVDTSKTSTKIAPKDKIEFNKFSFQYASLIAIALTLGLINIRDFTFIIKIGNVGFLVLVLYVIFLIYTTIANFVQNDPTSAHFEIFTAQIPYTAGTAALAFLLHPACAPIYNAQAHPENNSRDLKLGYTLSLILYFCFGIFGYLGIWGKEITTTANTVMDYYTQGVPGLLIDFLYIFKVMTSIPVVFYIATVAVFNLFRKNESDPIRMLHRQLFNTIYLGVLLVCGILNVQPQIVISFTGAFCGYFLGNIIPISMHWKCLYGRLPWEKKPDNYQELLDSDTQLIKKPGCLLGQNTQKLLVDADNIGDEEDALKEPGSNEGYFCDHSKVTKMPMALRAAYFITILTISLAIVGAQIYQVIQ